MTPADSSGARTDSTEPEAAPLPDGADLRRWTARRTRRHRRGVWALVGDIYTGLLTVAVVGTILAPYLRQLVDAPPSSPAAGGVPAGLGALGLEPGWLVLVLTMLLLALGLGPLSRLGPLFLRPHEAAWWLPMPGDRSALLVPVARVEYLIAATAGAVMGLLPALVAGGGWVAVTAWPALLAAGLSLVLSELIKAQVQGHGIARLRRFVILIGVAVCLVGTFLPFPHSAHGHMVVATVAGALVGAAVLGWRRARAGLGQVHDAALLDVVARSFGAHVSLLSLDTRAMGRLLSPPSVRPVGPAPLRWARLASRLPRPVGVMACVAQADWLLLRRQPRRLLQLGAGLAVAALPLLSESVSSPMRALAYLGGGWIATLAVAEPARQAWFDGGPDASWPAPPWVVRVGHLLTPAALMSMWSLLSLVPAMASLGAEAAWRDLGVVVAMALLSGWAWAGAALRSGYRTMPDFAAGLVTSPMGSLPPGLVQMLTAGPDAALVGALATALVAGAVSVPTTTVLGIQAAASAVVILWGLRTNRWAF
ncbi:DUF6297 family protein [Actinomyces sp. ZJ308]|uniref:DUF6297 family protein n=1 Tax=Actinomyces sp. ZJ308 TaxID=2708342 RepID=UPI00142487B3|nr:DUF6297 family protein [Actinomyces sp. ZJ308]